MMGGAGGGRGQGGEDQEHRNKYAMPEQLDDGLTREVDEYGERIIAQPSGQTVVAPVIGEANPEPPKEQPQRQPTEPPKEQPPAKPAAEQKPPVEPPKYGVVRSSNPYAPPPPVPPPGY